MSKTQITAEPGSLGIEIVREFDAPRDLVYRAFTEPELVAKWLGPRRLTMKMDHMDVREGGSYRYVHVDDQGNEYGFNGVYHGRPSVDGIVQTFEFEGMPGHVSLEKATFEEHDGRTVVRSLSAFTTLEDRDGMIDNGMSNGVIDSHERLDELLSELTPVG
jgi:uncharacterized protein YndB with AHSA1/START domain